ncbi:(Na+)-NQR maturation NqrM [Faucicola mancuniensis]|uniref:(Na+)-NQR maturation NqrM n=1 Tax=Faucicola mancuniensis TaxID=1309795 RepID=UPI003977E214
MLSQFLPIFFVTFAVFVLFFVFMGLGYIFKKQPLKGSCGGVAKLMGDEFCQFCGNNPNKCAEINSEQQNNGISEKAKQLGKQI